jgi:hypothetical protein
MNSRNMLLAGLLFVAPLSILANTGDQADLVGQKVENRLKEAAAQAGVEAEKAKHATQEKVAEVSSATKDAIVDNKGVIATLVACASAPFIVVFNTLPDLIAQNTLGKIAAMDSVKGTQFADLLNNKWFGRATVATAAVLAAMKLNKMYNNDQDTMDDEDNIFQN